MRVYFVVNPHSAHGRTRKAWPEMQALAEKTLGEVKVAFTERSMHAVELTRAALKEGYDRILSVGGDGTNNEVVNGFFEEGKPINPDAAMGVVCSGTGGDLIRTLKVPRDFREAIPRIPEWRVRPTDVGRLTYRDRKGNDVTRFYINITSAGVGGEVDYRVNKTTKVFGGKASFMWGSLRGALAYRNKPVTVRLDGGDPFTRTIFNIAVANGRFFGAGMMTAPEAEIDDGLFDVVMLGDFSFLEQIELSRKIYTGSHLTMKKVQHWRARRVELSCNERVLLDVDGEQPGKLPATMEIVPAAINMMRP